MMRLIFAFLLVCSIVVDVEAQSAKVKTLEQQRKAALEAIEQTNRLLNDAKSSTMSSLSKLKLITSEIENRRKVIDLLAQEVVQIERSQTLISQEIKGLERNLQEKRARYARAMQGLYAKRANYNKIIFVLSGENLNQSYRRMRYLREYSSWRKQQAQEIIDKQAELNDKIVQLERSKAEKQALAEARQKEREKLSEKEGAQKTLVADLRKKERSLQAELNKKRQQAAELNRQIERLIAQEAKNSGGDTNRKADTKGGYAMTEVEKELSGSFEKNKGQLPMPVTGSYSIVGRFGQQQHQELKYVKMSSNGIDIQTPQGSEARAVFNGTVTKVFVVPGYNSSVIIRHGNYLTVYSNLKDVYVKAGDSVSTRQAIGRIYTDIADGNRTVLHFQLWKETTKLNPELWLDK